MKKKLVSLFAAAAMLASFAFQIPASAEDFVLSRDKMLSPSDLAAHSQVTFDGKTVEEFNSSGKTAAVRYDNLNMSPSYSAANRYLLIEGYYKKSSATTTPYGMSVLFRSNGTTSDDWSHIYAQSDSVKKPSSGLTALPNRWETIAIDCQAALEYLSANSLTQKQLQIEIPSTTGDDRFYISSVRFSDSTGDFEFGRKAEIMSSSDLMSSPETGSFKGKADVQKFSVTSGAHTIRYGSIHMGHAFASSNKYMLVECYLDDETLNEFDITTVFRSVNNGATWINGNASSTKKSEKYAKRKWVTVVIDCTEPLASLATNKQSLTQLQIVIPDTTADFYVKSVRFAAAEPGVQYVYEDENGDQYTYLSEDGTVTVDGETLPAYTNTTDAFTGLGAAGGTVYLEGSLTAFTDVANGTRGAVLFRGLGDTAEDIAANVLYKIDSIEIKGGDITFDYLTVDPYVKAEGSNENPVNYTSFFTCQTNAAPIKHITIGEHMESAGMALGIRKGNETLYPNRDVFTVNGGTFYAITPLTNYGLTTINRLGTIDWTINGGTVHKLYAGSDNGWEWEQSQLRGDVKYTINGGTFDEKLIMGSAYGSTEIQGNIIWTINDGVMGNKTIVGGNENQTQGNRDEKYLNNVAAIVNLKGGKAGLSTLTLGTAGAKGLDINGKEIYILNNYEDNHGTKIAAGSLAEYKLHVYNGKAEPVFANDQTTTVNGSTEYFGGSLTGFRLTPDETGAVPYINGVAATPDGSGNYTISENTSGITDIVFVKSGTREVVSFAAENGTISALICNRSADSAPAKIYVAEFDNTGRFVTATPTDATVAAGEVKTVTAAYNKTNANHSYYAFIWDGVKPLRHALNL